MSERNRLYIFLVALCAVGYGWLFLSAHGLHVGHWKGCLTKQILNIPCPSCGTTRSVIALWHGHPLDALMLNPFGIIVSILMAVVPLWVAADVATGRATLLCTYRRVEQAVGKFWLPLALLVVANWVWNFIKYT